MRRMSQTQETIYSIVNKTRKLEKEINELEVAMCELKGKYNNTTSTAIDIIEPILYKKRLEYKDWISKKVTLRCEEESTQ